ncbi:hypothetical protein [Thermodesulfovibrio hydrogeniphilus]
MVQFFKSIKRGNFIFAWEPRGKWNDNLIKSLCEELELIHTVDPSATSSIIKIKIVAHATKPFKHTKIGIAIIARNASKKTATN